MDFSHKAVETVKMNLCAKVHSLLDSRKKMVMTPSTHGNPHLCKGNEVVSIIKTTIHSGDPTSQFLE
jgi:hypothetical protein